MSDFDLSYARRDVTEVLEDVKAKVRTLTEEQWTDFRDTDPGYAILKGSVALFDFNAFYVERMAAEGFLSLARYRESVIRRAKSLGYNPTRLTPATVSVRLSFAAFGTGFTIPADSLWRIDGKTFLCPTAISILSGATSALVDMIQGTRYDETYEAPTDDWYRLTYPKDIANVVLTVDGDVWNLIDSFIDVEDADSAKLYEDVNSYTILFGIKAVGVTKPTPGVDLNVNGIKTLGAKGNTAVAGMAVLPAGIISDAFSNDVTDLFSGLTLTAALGGTDPESTASIRTNAPKFYATQGRCVTAGDFEAVINQLPGIEESIVVGGEEIGSYGTVLIVIRGEDPYTVSDDLITLVKTTLSKLKVLTIQLNVKPPIVVEETLTVTVGFDPAVHASHAAANASASAAISGYFDTLKIADDRFGSSLTRYVIDEGGLRFMNFVSSLRSFITSEAGKIAIPLISNADLTSCVLKNASGGVLFSGDGTQYASDGYFNFTSTGLVDQKVTLDYKATSEDILTSIYQLVLLKSLTLTTEEVA